MSNGGPREGRTVLTGWAGIVGGLSPCDAHSVTTEGSGPGARTVPSAWQPEKLSGIPILYVTDFLYTLDQDGHTAYLTVGVATPPVVLGQDEEERRKRLDSIEFVPIEPVARFAVPRAKFDELIRGAATLPSSADFLEIIEKARGGGEE